VCLIKTANRHLYFLYSHQVQLELGLNLIILSLLFWYKPKWKNI